MVAANMVPFNVILRGQRIATVLHPIPEGMRNQDARIKVKADLVKQGYESDISVHQKRPDGTRTRGPSRKTLLKLEKEGKLTPELRERLHPTMAAKEEPVVSKPAMEVPRPQIPQKQVTPDVTPAALNKAMSNFVALFGGDVSALQKIVQPESRNTYTGPDRRQPTGNGRHA